MLQFIISSSIFGGIIVTFCTSYFNSIKALAVIFLSLGILSYWSIPRPQSYYKLLEIDSNATMIEIQQSFNHKAKLTQENTESFEDLKRAFLVLNSHTMRASYDQIGTPEKSIKFFLICKLLVLSGAEYLICYAISAFVSIKKRFKYVNSLTIVYITLAWALEIMARLKLNEEFFINNILKQYALFEKLDLPKYIFPSSLSIFMILSYYFYSDDTQLSESTLNNILATNKAIVDQIDDLTKSD